AVRGLNPQQGSPALFMPVEADAGIARGSHSRRDARRPVKAETGEARALRGRPASSLASAMAGYGWATPSCADELHGPRERVVVEARELAVQALQKPAALGRRRSRGAAAEQRRGGHLEGLRDSLNGLERGRGLAPL